MTTRSDVETIGAALVPISTVVYSTFDDAKRTGITNDEALYIALMSLSFEYENDSNGVPTVTAIYGIDVSVKKRGNVDAEKRCLELVDLCISALPDINIRSSWPLVKSVTREDNETQSTCRYRIEAETKITEVI